VTEADVIVTIVTTTGETASPSLRSSFVTA
jgi:hypothetical protein